MGSLGPFAENTIVVGDCLDVMRQMPDGCCNLIVMDPPFGTQGWTSTHYGYQFGAGVNWSAWAALWIAESYRLLKEQGSVFAVGNYQGFHYLAYELSRVGFKHQADYQVAYKGSRKRPTPNKFHVVTESWFYGTKGGGLFRGDEVAPLTGNNTHLSYWLDPDGTVRRWEKSEDLMAYFIALTTLEGDLVADFFMGSGTTAIAADRLGRKWFGCDINPDYVAMALERIEADRRGRAQLELIF